MRKIVLSILLSLFALPAFAQQTVNLTVNSAFGPWLNYTQGQQMPCVSFGTAENPPPVSIHTFGYWPATGTVSAVTMTIRGNQGGADFDVTTATNTAGTNIIITGWYNKLCMKVTTLSGAGASITGSYVGNVAGATLGSVTITGDVTSATAANFKSMVSGTGADGAAVVGNPVRVAGKDGSGNTQDICTDTAGDVCIGVADGLDVSQGAKADAQCLTTDTTQCSAIALLKGNLAQLKLIVALANTDPCSGTLKTPKPFNISTGTTTVLVAASASNKVYICSLDIIVSTANNVALVEDATGSCASPDAGMAGGTTAATGWNFAANGGLSKGNGAGSVYQTASTNVNVCFITSGTAQTSGALTYVLAP